MFKQYDNSLETEEASFYLKTDGLVKGFIETSNFTSVIFMSKLFELILNGLNYIVKYWVPLIYDYLMKRSRVPVVAVVDDTPL